MATCLLSRKLYKLDKPDMQDTAGEAKTNSSVMYSYEPPHKAKQNQDDQLEHTYSSYVRIRDVALKTCQKRWMIKRSSERGSVLATRHDDDDIMNKNCSRLPNLTDIVKSKEVEQRLEDNLNYFQAFIHIWKLREPFLMEVPDVKNNYVGMK